MTPAPAPRTHRIAVIAGDGIGPEVIAEALKVLAAIAPRHGIRYETTLYPFSTDRWLATGGERGGETLPDSAFTEIQQMDAVLLGAIGDPRAPVGLVEHGIIMRLRVGLDLFVNLRPVKLYDERLCPLKDKRPQDVDMLFVRENTEDAYTAKAEFTDKGGPDEVAVQPMRYTRKGTERVIRYAFDVARRRAKGRKLLMIDKANAVRAQDLWARVFAEVGQEYPDIAQEHAYIDAACMWMLKNPEWFDVAVTTNLFGDIITDVGAMLQGGLGIAASGNIHPGRVSLFEPIHGSAPKYKGQNVANPVASVMAVSMMLDHLGHPQAAQQIEEAVSRALRENRIRSLSAGVQKTSEIGDLLAQAVAG
ncbi:MAG TPA: 3-isopropylmalate dehydrogenase [Planctomycetota bacterium]|nr:3-isopropylmalate dehydrogenase [Planctomycetota bacterium]